MQPEPAGKLADLLAGGYFTHDFPITVERARDLGLPVTAELPPAVYDLMALFPQPSRGRPTVTYLPLPAPGPGPRRRRRDEHPHRRRVVTQLGPLHPAQVLAVQLQRHRLIAGSTSAAATSCR